MIKINGENYKIIGINVVKGEMIRTVQSIETKEIVNLSHSKRNGYMLWVPEGTVMSPGIRCEVPRSVELDEKSESNGNQNYMIYGEDGSSIPLNMTGRKFQPYRGRQFWN